MNLDQLLAKDKRFPHLKCERCEGDMYLRRRGSDNKPFLGCEHYPQCRCSMEIRQGYDHTHRALTARFPEVYDRPRKLAYLLEVNLFYLAVVDRKRFGLLAGKLRSMVDRLVPADAQIQVKADDGDLNHVLSLKEMRTK